MDALEAGIDTLEPGREVEAERDVDVRSNEGMADSASQHDEEVLADVAGVPHLESEIMAAAQQAAYSSSADEEVEIDEDDDDDDDDDVFESDEEIAAARDVAYGGTLGEAGRGCLHYRRGCKLVGPCCGESFWCRFCHDAAKEHGSSATDPPHKLDRHAVQQVECGLCGLRQPVAQTCINMECGNCFGNYFCRVCNFFDDDLSKEPFHCDGCGICR